MATAAEAFVYLPHYLLLHLGPPEVALERYQNANSRSFANSVVFRPNLVFACEDQGVAMLYDRSEERLQMGLGPLPWQLLQLGCSAFAVLTFLTSFAYVPQMLRENPAKNSVRRIVMSIAGGASLGVVYHVMSRGNLAGFAFGAFFLSLTLLWYALVATKFSSFFDAKPRQMRYLVLGAVLLLAAVIVL